MDDNKKIGINVESENQLVVKITLKIPKSVLKCD